MYKVKLVVFFKKFIITYILVICKKNEKKWIAGFYNALIKEDTTGIKAVITLLIQSDLLLRFFKK